MNTIKAELIAHLEIKLANAERTGIKKIIKQAQADLAKAKA